MLIKQKEQVSKYYKQIQSTAHENSRTTTWQIKNVLI